MKTTLISSIKLAFLCTVLAGALFTFSDRASAFSTRDLAASSGDRDRSTYINHLTGMVVRNDESTNVQYFRPDNLTPRGALNEYMIGRNVSGDRGIIMIPRPGGGPAGTVPDGGMTAMLLGAALGALGIARRYLRA
jgi:hypothetical protein